jgi:putative hydrolase of the HAD superfamily
LTDAARPKAILLDAGGTLFEPVRPVGETYALVAGRYGVTADPRRLQARFAEIWRRWSASVPSGSDVLTADDEKEWWRHLVREVFDGGEAPANFDAFFDELHLAFGEADQWRIYPEVPAALDRLRAAGCSLAVVSNWDARLEPLCVRLGLRDRFASVVASGPAGASKPDPRIFTRALDALGVRRADALHVGDSFRDDVEGARRAGIRAVWLRRDGDSDGDAPEGVTVVRSLAELAERMVS